MRQFAFVALVLVLTGCASGPLSAQRNLESSSQQQGQIIACSGYKMWPACYEAAQQTCPGGFEVLAKEENLPTQMRTLRISCK